MAETSGFWTTNGTGDGPSAKYSRADMAKFHKIIAACKSFEGVAPGFLNELVGSVTGANTVSINTGGGVVDGIAYHNSAAVSVTIPSASGAGNTRIDRIVLRVSWAAQTARITRLPGTDAASPSAPAITQTSETTYDITLCQALVNTSGTVTLTDERTFAATTTNGILTNAVTTAKIADDAVNYDKAGDRIPKVYGRQGGSSTIWSSNGTTNYTPTTVKTQCGSVSCGAGASPSVTFPTPFAYQPLVFISPNGALTDPVQLLNVTANGFALYNPGSVSASVYWFAIGPE